jgi:RNA polymerase sigma-70 factor (ECF subfamily)
MPDEPEARGLLALMLLHDARRDARYADGELVLLDDQDRALWDHEQIAAGRAELERAIGAGRGPYVLQAAIAALQVEDPRDRVAIATLYGELARLTGSPVVELNWAVALAEAGEPQVGLAVLAELPLEDYRYFHSARGDLFERVGRFDEARAAFERALELADDEPERRLLTRRLAELADR